MHVRSAIWKPLGNRITAQKAWILSNKGKQSQTSDSIELRGVIPVWEIKFLVLLVRMNAVSFSGEGPCGKGFSSDFISQCSSFLQFRTLVQVSAMEGV